VSTDYAAIYDRIFEQHPGYRVAERSPGFRTVLRYAERLRGLRGRSLDVGCGYGFVVQALGSAPFSFRAFGCDVSQVAIDRARDTLGDEEGADRIRLIERDGRLPFGDAEFDLVTCFDVLEHIDEQDLPRLRDELLRVRQNRGGSLYTVSLRPAGSADHNGDNLHRTVRPVQFWIDLFQPDETMIEHGLQQAALWIGPRG